MELRVLLSAVAVVSSLGHADALRDGYAIDTFDNPESLAGWNVTGPGSLALGSGYRGSGAVVSYKIDAGARVIVTWTPTGPVPKIQNSTISLWVRFSGNLAVTLRTEDAAGKTLLFPVEPSLDHSRPDEWQYALGHFKKRIAGLALILQSRTDKAVEGDLLFDEVMLSKAANSFRLGPEEQSESPSANATRLPIMGVNIHLLRDEPSLDLARAAGFQFVRMDLLWKNIERRGRFRFFAYDFLMRQLESRGMGVLWILDYGHPDHGGDVPRNTDDVAAFARFAEAVASHYRGRNVRYEIWNEPNNPQFWPPSPNATEYGTLLGQALTAMRRADPSAIISSGGISNLDLSFARQVLNRSVAPMLGAVSVHPYSRDKPESIVPAYDAFRSWVANELGGCIQMWISEWGYSSTLSHADSAQKGHGDRDRYRQASLAVREILTLWSLGVPLGVWYDLRDDGEDPGNPEQNYGLLDSAGREKPAMHAVRNLMNSKRDREFTGMVQQSLQGVHAMRFRGAKDELYITWTDIPERHETLECERKDFISAADMMGRALEMKSGPKGYLRIRMDENAGPIYVLLKTASQKRAT